jgi:hypothetical protein
LWLSTSIIDLLLLIFLQGHEESNYKVWSASWWATGLSTTRTRADEDAKINEMISTETFKIFTGDEAVAKILLPINVSSHWILVVIDTKKKTISSYDSAGSDRSHVLNRIKKYLACKAKAEGVEVTDEWTKSWTYVTGSCPRQGNSYDCGMFVLCCARCVLHDISISSFVQHGTAKVEEFLFGQGNMLRLRRRFILEIHKLHLSNRLRDGLRELACAGQPRMQKPRQPVGRRPNLPR